MQMKNMLHLCYEFNQITAIIIYIYADLYMADEYDYHRLRLSYMLFNIYINKKNAAGRNVLPPTIRLMSEVYIKM